MKHPVFLFFIASITTLVLGCSGNSDNSAQMQSTEERVFVVNLVHDSLKLNEYLNYHKKIWPEVEEGFKKAGYQKIVLYRYNYLLVMTISVPAGADLNAMGKLAESYSPRCAEWNRLMGEYQQGVEGTPKGETWVEGKPFYRFDN